MSLMEQLEALAKECASEEQEIIEKMIVNAAEYVKEVIMVETTVRNLLEQKDDAHRKVKVIVEEISSMASLSVLILAVDSVNRICKKYNQPLIYTGDEQRRHYGDFAMELTTEIFKDRK